MNNKILQKPLVEPVSLDEVKTYLRLDTNEENALVEQLIRVARRLVEDYTSLALITQVHRVVMRFDECHEGRVVLPIAPFQELAALPQSLVGTRIEDIRNHSVDQSQPRAVVKLNNYFSDRDLVRVDYRCGYGDTADSVPEPLRQAILLLIAELYENRPGEKPSKVLPGLVRALINPYRVLHVV